MRESRVLQLSEEGLRMHQQREDENVRYPFQAAANKFLDSYVGVYSEGMWVELERRYRKLNHQLYWLWKEKKIESMDPAKMSAEDIKQYVLWRRSKGLKDTSIAHDITAIGNLCDFVNGNRCVQIARSRYPMLFAKKRKVRLPVIEREDFAKICKIADSHTETSNPLTVRKYAAVMLCLCAGLRTQELQYSKVANLSKDMTTLFLDHVKGMGSYGSERYVPVRRECFPIMSLWLQIRPEDSEYIFPAKDGGVLVTNTLRKGCREVVAETGVEFDFRKCRRTYAQYLVDEGLFIQEVSVVLGHSSTKTTESSYARPRDDRVIRKVVEMWENPDNKEE